MTKKAIILCGGTGTRMYPSTLSTNKHLLPVYDKPMIYYPLSVLMLSGIKEILIISAPNDISKFKELLGNGSDWGIKLEYKIQPSPDGVAQAFILGEEFIGKDNVALILGDNFFYGQGFTQMLSNAVQRKSGATLFAYQVKDPQRFGIVEFDENRNVLNIVEKPQKPKSNYAVTGLYFYDNSVIEIAKQLKPSNRGELEISNINEIYLKKGLLKVELLGRGFAWLDTGTFDTLMQASMFVQTIENRQGHKVACIEEISFRNKWISKIQLVKLAKKYDKSGYGDYLLEIIKENK